MIKWVFLRAGQRPVPRPVATPLVWTAACATALLFVVLLNTVAGTRPLLALTVLSVLATMLGFFARFTAAPGTAVLCWLFLNGFAIPPTGVLSWTADRDTFWLTCLLAATLAGTTAARVAHARAAYHSLTPAPAVPTTVNDEPHAA
ncbi:hypothetical protein ABII15_34015 [Streptomyces sp. HUAS MG91]|uniref:Integral membrane protein n=1 Tax=Streptomyces tabacisoli TaxID=3156398 RepID=A0AAU8J2E4_9ACTN